MNILIADDEALMRTSLQLYLEAEQVPRRCIFHAENTAAMLNCFKEKRIDLAFVDIRMPGPDGLAAIEAGKKLQPETHFYVLTGYGKFEYAQKALQLHIEDYLLKPVAKEQIRLILEKERAYRQARIRQKQESYARLLSQPFREHSATPVSLPDVLLCFCGRLNPESFQSLIRQIDSRLEQELDLECIRCSFLCWEYFILQPNADSSRVKPVLERMLRQLPCSALLETGTVSLQSVQADSLQMIFAPFGTCHTSVDEFSRLRGIGQTFSELVYFDQEQKYEQFCLAADRFTTLLGQKRADLEPDSLRQLLELLKHFFSDDPEKAVRPEDVSSLLHTWAADHLLHRLAPEHGLLALRQYVETHYQEKITLPQLARQFGYTPNYISSAFRRYTGFTVTQYLNQIRLSHACRLLRETSLTIQETADAAGYSDSNYFTRMFTQQYHCTPTSYRKRAGNDPEKEH